MQHLTLLPPSIPAQDWPAFAISDDPYTGHVSVTELTSDIAQYHLPYVGWPWESLRVKTLDASQIRGLPQPCDDDGRPELWASTLRFNEPLTEVRGSMGCTAWSLHGQL